MSSPRAIHELQRRLEREHAEREQGRELADAVAGGADIVAERAGLAQLGELRRVQRHAARAASARCAAGRRRDGAARARRRAAARSGCARRRRAARSRAAPACARRRGPRPRARRASARARRRRGRAAARPGRRRRAPSARARRAPRRARRARRRRARSPRRPARPSCSATRVACSSSAAPSATGATNSILQRLLAPASPSQTASTTNADARAAVHAPCTIGSLQAAEPRGEHAAVQRVVVAADARERVHARRRVVVRLGERHARARQARRRRAGQPRHGGAERMLWRASAGACQSISTGASPSRRSVPSARHVAAPARGSSVVQRTFSASRSPGAGADAAEPRLLGEPARPRPRMPASARRRGRRCDGAGDR